MVEGEPGDHGQQLPGLEAVGDELGLVGEGPMVVEDSLGMTGGAGGVLQEGRGVRACGHGLVNVGRLGELVWREDLRGGGEGRQIQACGGVVAMTTVGEESVMMWCRRSVSGPRVMGKGTGMGIIPRYMAPRMRMRRRSSPGMRGSTLSPGVPGRWAAATAISSHN